ncbi:uncharacterized protein [Rhodnius prolixus]|uniref:uncharacterized protein n=1 Tax=Rhodnius prolixus TaxID=13249 RepID=UPI003D18D3CA
MSLRKEIIDTVPDEHGTFVVYTKNLRKLLYDGLINTFSAYGKIVTIRHLGKRGVQIRYVDKSSAMLCYHDLCDHPDFMVELPHKFRKPDVEDPYLVNDLNIEAGISFPKNISRDLNKNTKAYSRTNRYLCQKRKIIRSSAFKCFMIALTTINQYRQVKDYYASLTSEVRRRMQDIDIEFRIGFEDEEEHNWQKSESPQLILAKDLHYFHISEPVPAVDVLICCLPPWYGQVDAYKLIFPLVPDDLLQIDWYITYPSRTNEFSQPYGIVYLKTRRAAATLRYSTDDLVIDNHKISVCFMEDVENILVDVIGQCSSS